MSNDKSDLLVLFGRPKEPIYLPRNDGQLVVDIPSEYYDNDRNEGVLDRVFSKRSGQVPERTIIVNKVDNLPNLDFAKSLDRDGAFSLFLVNHSTIAGKLIEIFMEPTTIPELMSISTYVRERVNPYLFQYAFSVALQHRPDTKDLEIPSILTTLPEQFVDPKVMPKLMERAAIFEGDERKPVSIPREFTASDREVEHQLAYFREDIGVNLHHWHWHLVYPTRGPRAIVDKDRRGELFFYMHNQIIARYNVERFCNNLDKVKPLNNLREPVPEAYFPKIIRGSNNRAYPPRAKDSLFQDLDRIDSDTKIEIADLERWRDRIIEAIDRGFVENARGDRFPLDDITGIDMLGNMVEASDLSINQDVYGQLHNCGHDIISYIHDPDYRHLEDYGVMGDVATAVRDPIFYRWHSFIDGIFQKHKAKVTRYGAVQLNYEQVTVSSVEVKMTKGASPVPNKLLTFWSKSAVDLQAGMDFNNQQGSVFAEFEHLNHAPFVYNINVDNTSGTTKRGTCRIFLGPKYDAHNRLLSMQEKRLLMIEMDKWIVTLAPGTNTIVRLSTDSNVTIPEERTFRSVAAPSEGEAQYRFCSCGWPHHMLLPKGSTSGVQFDLFVMISNIADDEVVQDIVGICNDSHVFCGIRDKKYPDKRSMGFPFDRPLANIDSLETFARNYSNMNIADVNITYVNTVVKKF